MRKFIVFGTGLLILCLVNVSIYSREQILTHGRVVLLELAPVDPRSLMQGDYMALRFRAADHIRWNRADKEALDGHIVLTLDEYGVGTFSHMDNGAELATNRTRMRFRVRNNRIRFATNAFFFQEGDAQLYENARYGEFRVADNGESILIGMRDGALKPLGQKLVE